MGDRVSRLVLTFDGEAGSIDAVLSGIKGSVRSAVADIERTAGKVSAFGDLEKKVKASAEAMFDASTNAKILAAELDKVTAAGGKATPELVNGLKAANKEVDKTTAAYNKNVDALSKMQAQLVKAGVDTSNLARAQLQLAEASKKATAAAEQQAAKQALGLKTLADIQPQIQKLQAAYTTLRDSGTLSSREIGIAQSALQARLRETYGEVTKLQGGVGGLSSGFGSLLTGAASRFLGLTAIIGTMTAALVASAEAAKGLKQGLAEIGAVTNLTQEQLDALGDGVRTLATTIGFDLQSGLKALFDLIRSGVPVDNALAVLEVSATAAKAALTDIGTGAKASALLIDGFGLEVGQLSGALDKIIRGSKDGGATLKEFADNAGPLLNVAREARVPFDQLVATLTVMTDASNDAAGSVGALTKIIVALGNPEVRGKLKSLGIESTNLVDVFRELGERGIPLQQIIDLGLASTRTAAGVTALTNNAGKLVPELERIKSASGDAAKGVAALYDSPQARAARFDAALHDTAVEMGQLIGSSSKLASVAADVINKLNGLGRAARGGAVEGSLADNVVSRWVANLLGMAPAAKAATAAADETAAAMKRAGEEAAISEAGISKANAALVVSAQALLTEVQALQAASTRDVADVTARAEAEIAALDRSAQAQAATAAATIAIQTKLAADRLAIIQKSEAEVLAAVAAATAAREQTLRTQGTNEKQIAADLAKTRIDALVPVLKQYQDHYNALVTLAQQAAAKVNSIEAERVEFNRNVENVLLGIRMGSLSALDQYAAKVKEIDRLISEARRAGVDGDIASAKKFTDQAIALSTSLKEVVNKDGAVVIRGYEAQATAIDKIGKAAGAYNDALDKQDTLATEGLNATKAGIDAVLPRLQNLQATYAELKKSVAEGLGVKVSLDEQSVAASLATINELTKPRTVVITTETVQGNSGGGPIVAPFARGGLIGQIANRFAAGGSVFRSPSWHKVPGSGSGDTVPAALRPGSFVIRKAASQYYGDAAMARLAQGFAIGGSVSKLGPARSALGGALGGAAPYWAEFADTLTKLRRLQEASAGTPRPSKPYIGLGDWAARLVQDFVFYSKGHRDQIKSLIDTTFEGWLGGIESARALRLPLTMDLSMLGILQRYARGGDVVPAMLTPGEYVIKPQAVAKYGGGLMHALNNMQVPRAMLDNVLNFPAPRPRVAHFASGGAVGSLPVRNAGAAVSGGGNLTVQIYAQSVDEATIRRDVIPVLNKVMQKGR
jgi:Phage-related minor tail protein